MEGRTGCRLRRTLIASSTTRRNLSLSRSLKMSALKTHWTQDGWADAFRDVVSVLFCGNVCPFLLARQGKQTRCVDLRANFWSVSQPNNSHACTHALMAHGTWPRRDAPRATSHHVPRVRVRVPVSRSVQCCPVFTCSSAQCSSAPCSHA